MDISNIVFLIFPISANLIQSGIRLNESSCNFIDRFSHHSLFSIPVVVLSYMYILSRVQIKINIFNTERYIKRNSFLFDFKLGEYLITPILDHSCKIKKEEFNREHVINEIKEFNKPYIKQIEQLSPNFYPQDKWWGYFKEEIDRSTENRPWEVHEELPKYREVDIFTNNEENNTPNAKPLF